MYDVTVTVEAKGTAFENAVYKRTMSFVFHDSIEAERLRDHCRARGFACTLVRMRTLDSAKDAIEEINEAIKEMRR